MMNSSIKRNWIAALILVAILVIGAVLRIIHLRDITGNPDFSFPSLDAGYHDYWARALSTGDWTIPDNALLDKFSDPEIRTSPYFRPPGYPYFLAFIYLISGGSYLFARIAQMGLGLINCLLAYSLGRNLFGRGVGLVFAALMSGYWAFIYFEGQLLAPVLMITAILLLFRCIARWFDKRSFGSAFAIGLLFGISALIRPNILLFGPVLLGWMVWVHRRGEGHAGGGKMGLGFILAAALVITPVTIRNYLVSGESVLITANTGINLFIANNADSDGFTPSARALEEISGTGGWRSSDYPRIVRTISARLGRSMNHSEVSAHFSRLAYDYIRDHPLETLTLMGRKTALFWGPSEVSNNREIDIEKRDSALLRYLPGFPFALSFSLVGLLVLFFGRSVLPGGLRVESRTVIRQHELSVVILLFVITYFISYLPFFVAGRFRIPVIPFLLLFGAIGIHRAGRLLASREWSWSFAVIGAWLGFYLLARISIVPYTPDLSRWHFNRGVAYSLAGQVDASVEEYGQAVRLKPDFELYHRNLADMLVKQENYRGAIDHYLEALRLKPGQVNVHNNLGNAYQIEGDFDSAIDHYQQALAIDPNLGATYRNLGISYQLQGRLDEAVGYYRRTLEFDPDDVDTHYNLANILKSMDRPEEAMHHFRQIVRIAPEITEVHVELAQLLVQLAMYDEAAEQFQTALDQNPGYLAALNGLAWLLATHPDSGSRDPDRAVELAGKAAELSRNQHPVVLNTLAAAYASAGRFDLAVETAEKAIDLAASSPDPTLVNNIRSRLDSYRRRKLPWETTGEQGPARPD